MVLLILPVLWAVVLLPYWVRYARERRTERSAASPGRRSSRQRRAAVRYVFGAYDPYRDEHLLRDASSLETDASYLPEMYRRRRPAWQDAYAQDAYDDSYFDGQVVDDDIYLDEVGDDYGDDIADVRELPTATPAPPVVATSPAATPRGRRAAVPLGNGPVRVVANRENHISGALTSSSRLALRRRRQIFFVLMLGFLASLGSALWFGSLTAWGVHAGVAMLLSGYVSLLVRHHQRTVDRSAKVRRLAPAAGRRPSRPAVVVLSGGTAR